MDDPTNGIGDRMRHSRYRLGWFQEHLSAASGVALSSIERHETGRQVPGLRTVCRLASALGVRPASLAFGDGPELIDPDAPAPDRPPLPERFKHPGRSLTLAQIAANPGRMSFRQMVQLKWEAIEQARIEAEDRDRYPFDPDAP